MKKVLFVLPALNIGGAEKSIIDLFENIDYSKYDMNLLLLAERGVLAERINRNVTIIELDESSKCLFKTLSSSYKYLMKNKQISILVKKILLSFIKRLSSIVPAININHLTWFLIKKYLRKFENTYDFAVAYLQGLSEYYVVDKVVAKNKILWMHTSFIAHSTNNKFETKYINAYDKIVCVSEAARLDFIKLFPNKKSACFTFYNIIDRKKIEENAKLPMEIEFDENYFNIVSIGRLHECKGYDLSIRAIAKLAKEYKIRFYIIGSGSIKNKLIQQIKGLGLDSVCYLLGVKENPYPYMLNADIILQASRYEGFCIVLSESKVLRKPIITTDFFGAKEQIINNKTGMIIDCNVNSIYNSIKKCLDNPTILADLSNNLDYSNLQRDINKEFNEIFR